MNNEFIFLLSARSIKQVHLFHFHLSACHNPLSKLRCGLYEGIKDINDNRKIKGVLQHIFR